MRKLIQRKDTEKKNKRNALILGSLLLTLMLLSTIGYGFLSNPKTEDDETDSSGIKISEVGTNWVVDIEDQRFYFSSSPYLNLTVSESYNKYIGEYFDKPLYIDAENSGIVNEIGVNLARFTSRFQEACYGECERDLPEKNCTENMIVWRESDLNSIYNEENCVFIEGNMATVDHFLYKLLGIKQ